MKQQISVAIVTLMFFIPTLLFAHGSFTHVLGTVTETTEDQIVVQTIKGGVITLTITPETIYQHNGITTKDIRPEVGNRIIAEAKKRDGQLVSKEIRFSSLKESVSHEIYNVVKE